MSVEIAKRAGGLLRREEPAPVPPPPVPVPDAGRKRDATPFTPTDPRDVPPRLAPSPAQAPEPPRRGEKGKPRVDIYRDLGDGEARIYELKTGSAREKEARIHRLFKDTFFGKISRATFAEIWVP